MNIRLALVPVGSFDDQGLLARPVTLFFSSPDGTKQIEMKTGKPLAPIDLTLPLLGDTVSSYPWDSYQADMDLLFLTTDGSKVAASTSSSGGGSATTTTTAAPGSSAPAGTAVPNTPSTPVAPAPETPPTSEGAAAKAPPIGESAMPAQTDTTTPAGGSSGGADKPAVRPDTVVPVELNVFTNIPAYTVVEVLDATPNDDGVIEAVFNVKRGPTAIVYSLFVSALMWVLAFGVLFIGLSVLFRRRKLELAVISMMGIVLFAMPAALRSFQPGVPPPGVLSDFYSFFWCVAIVALTLVTMLITFLTRGPD